MGKLVAAAIWWEWAGVYLVLVVFGGYEKRHNFSGVILMYPGGKMNNLKGTAFLSYSLTLYLLLSETDAFFSFRFF